MNWEETRNIGRQRGLTIIELVVATMILTVGSAVLWYGLRSSLKLDKLNRMHHVALMAARSDLESLRVIPKENIHDTVYDIDGPGDEPMRLVRQVFDSVRIMATLKDIALDEKLAPQELRKPLEVQVKVLLTDPSSESGGLAPWPPVTDPASLEKRILVSLILKLPEYQWY